jgi:hypothetical protein
VTGHGLKDPDVFSNLGATLRTVAPNEWDVMRAMED